MNSGSQYWTLYLNSIHTIHSIITLDDQVIGIHLSDQNHRQSKRRSNLPRSVQQDFPEAQWKLPLSDPEPFQQYLDRAKHACYIGSVYREHTSCKGMLAWVPCSNTLNYNNYTDTSKVTQQCTWTHNTTSFTRQGE